MFTNTRTLMSQQLHTSKGVLRIVLVAGALSVTAMGSWHGLNNNHRTGLATGVLTVLSERNHDFGVMDQDKERTHKFQIKNDGQANLLLELIDRSCGCTTVKIDGREMALKQSGLPSLSPIGVPDLGFGLSFEDVTFEQDSHADPSGDELSDSDLEQLLANLPGPSAFQPEDGESMETAASQEPHVLRPGAQAVVELTWNTGMNSGPIRQYVQISTSDPDRPVADFSVEGEVIPLVGVSETPIIIQSVHKHETTYGGFRVFAPASDTLRPRLVSSSNPLVTVEFEPISKESRSSNVKSEYIAEVEIAPGLPAGPFHVELVIATNVPDRPELTVSVFGQVDGDMTVVPSGELNFNLVSREKGQSRSLLVEHHEGEAEYIRVARVTPSFVKSEVSAVRSDDGVHKLAIVKLTVPAGSPAGPFEGRIQLESTKGDSSASVTIPIRGQVRQ